MSHLEVTSEQRGCLGTGHSRPRRQTEQASPVPGVLNSKEASGACGGRGWGGGQAVGSRSQSLGEDQGLQGYLSLVGNSDAILVPLAEPGQRDVE